MLKSGVGLKDIKKIVESMEEGGFIEGRNVPENLKKKKDQCIKNKKYRFISWVILSV